ncbi:MAG: hypothetical protein AAGK21_12385 [Bacteroidota bacterium]
METDPAPTPSTPDRKAFWWGPILLGLTYGLVARFLFGFEPLEFAMAVMTLSFIILVPGVIGALTVLWWQPEPRWWLALFLPWVPSLLLLATTFALLWEGLICIVVWLPMALLCASIGGVIGKLLRRSSRGPATLVLAALPIVVAPIETQFEDPVHVRTVHDAIVIEADAADVWEEIREVPPIRPEELGDSFAYRIGFPRPIEARLEGEGVGSVRYATFEGGVTFIERVTEWEEDESLAFTIDASAVPSTTFDEHVAVGGRYFDVLNGRYEIEPVAPGRVVLHLTSEQRLGTRFNGYTQLWTDRFMGDIQETILEVVKARAEAR